MSPPFCYTIFNLNLQLRDMSRPRMNRPRMNLTLSTKVYSLIYQRHRAGEKSRSRIRITTPAIAEICPEICIWFSIHLNIEYVNCQFNKVPTVHNNKSRRLAQFHACGGLTKVSVL